MLKSCEEGQAVTLTGTLLGTSSALRDVDSIIRDLHDKLRGSEPVNPECCLEKTKVLQREPGILELADQNHKLVEVLRSELAGILQRL